MKAFRVVEGIAAPMAATNIDTDQIMPKQFLKTLTREGLRDGVFHDARFDAEGRPRPEFVLNREPYREARILVAGSNFGCGSSREHAVWGLREFGIRCVIAPSFGEIFWGNAFKNGLLLVMLPIDHVERLLAEIANPDTTTLVVDLPQQRVCAAGRSLRFDISALHKEMLMNALDPIDLSLRHLDDIESFETNRKAVLPWL
jgi:3-isopropylmalate/(R)-2-methylmalate dehydratase small subunit